MSKVARKTHIFERDEHDHYVEPLDVGPALFALLDLAPGTVVLDPCCGWGRMVRAAQAARLHTIASDIVPRWESSPDGEFAPYRDAENYLCLTPTFMQADWFDRGGWCPSGSPTWRNPEVIASNPPYDRADEFLELALERAASMIALVLPATWHHGSARSLRLEKTPLYKILPITPRPSMPPGAHILSGQKVGSGTKDFSVFIWLKGYRGAHQGGWLRRAKP